MPNEPVIIPALLRDAQVATLLGISPRQVWKLAATGNLPKPVQVPGTRSTRWKRDDLLAHVESLSPAK